MSAPTDSVPVVDGDAPAEDHSSDVDESSPAGQPQVDDDEQTTVAAVTQDPMDEEAAAADAHEPVEDAALDGSARVPARPAAAPEMAPPGWSAFTPVVPPGPLPFDPEPAARGWEQVSVRNGDDEAWLRALREAAGEEPSGLVPAATEGPALPVPAAKPITAPPPSWEDSGPEAQHEDQHQDSTDDWTDDWADHRPDDRDAKLVHVLEPDVEPQPAPLIKPELEPELEPVLEPVEPEPVDDFPAETAPAVSDDPVESASGPRPSFGRASAKRLSRAVSQGPDDVDDEPPAAVQDDEPLRGTLAPVLRRSTERARYPTSTTPVVRPPVLPPPPGDLAAPAPARSRFVTWEEALAGDVVPGKNRRRPGRRMAKARHESGGHAEYRPRTVDRSLTLLVVGMLLVLILLVGVAAWAFWPRIAGARSLPMERATGTAAASRS
jgi:hypothetical protein